jgi:tagatose 6-phosphate kinase
VRPIFIACPNLSLDRTVEVEELAIGGIHRTVATDVRGGGKGVNVARALACIGVQAPVIGWLGGRTGDAVRALLADEQIVLTSLRCPGETRSCITVLAGGTVTVINEPGPAVDADEWNAFMRSLEDWLEPESIFVCSGSWPPGTPDGSAADAVSLARERSCRVICDTSGPQLTDALAAAPDLVTPNLAEAVALLQGGRSERVEAAPAALEDARAAAAALLRRGPRAVLVTAGAAGAALARSGEIEVFPAHPVKVRNPVGAGDCLVAGIADGLARGRELTEAVERGMAMAAAGCETFPAGLLDPERADALYRSSSAI